MFDEKRKNDYKYLDCYAADIEGDKLYVVSVLFGIVLEYDLRDFSYKILTQINLPDSSQMVRVNSIIKSKHFLYITLWNSWNIFEYDIESEKLEVYGNDFEYIDGNELVVKSYLYQDRIWIFPYNVDQKIRIFHIKTKEFEVNLSVKEILNQRGYRIPKSSFICLDIFQEKCKCILAIYNSSYLIEINLETEKYNIYEVKPNARIEIMSYIDGQYWLSYIDNKNIKRWSPEDEILEMYEPAKNYIQKERRYRYIFSYKEKVIIVPTYDKTICIIDKKTRKETILEYSKDIQRVHNRDRWMFYGFIEYFDKILLLPFSMTHFIVIDLQNERLESYQSKFGTDVIYEYWIKPRLTELLLLENDIFEFSEYLDFISEHNTDIKKQVSGVGKKIWMQLI